MILRIISLKQHHRLQHFENGTYSTIEYVELGLRIVFLINAVKYGLSQARGQK